MLASRTACRGKRREAIGGLRPCGRTGGWRFSRAAVHADAGHGRPHRWREGGLAAKGCLDLLGGYPLHHGWQAGGKVDWRRWGQVRAGALPAPQRPRCSPSCVHEHAPPLRWRPGLRFRRVWVEEHRRWVRYCPPPLLIRTQELAPVCGAYRGRSARPEARSGRRQGPLPAGEVCTAQKRVGDAVAGVFVPGGAETSACKQGVAVRAYPLPPLIGARSRLGGCLAVADNGAEAGAGRA